MKTMPLVLLLGAFALVAGAQAQTNFTICEVDVQSAGDWILVDNLWSKDVARIKVAVRVREKVATSNLIAKVYLYTKDKEPLATLSPVPARHRIGTLLLDKTWPGAALPKHDSWELFFPLTGEVRDQCKTIIVVFGVKNDLVAKLKGGTKFEDYAFAEKDKVKNLKPPGPNSPSKLKSPDS